LIGKPEWKRLLERHLLNMIVGMIIIKPGCEGVDCTRLLEDRIQW